MRMAKMNLLAGGIILTVCLFWHAAAVAGDTELTRALDGVNIFSTLTGPEKNLIKKAARLRQGKAGEQIISQGKIMDRMIVILDGEAEVKIDTRLVASLSGQILLGELEFLDGQPACADVFLLRDTQYLSLDYSMLNRLLEDHPRMGYLVIREIARIEAGRLRKTSAE